MSFRVIKTINNNVVSCQDENGCEYIVMGRGLGFGLKSGHTVEREQAEKALLTGIPLKERQEVKDNEIAHKEFLRLKKLLEKINK